jgi:hypothetical protein
VTLSERFVRKAVSSSRAADEGSHDKWLCPCGGHTANIPRHTFISPGVVADTMTRLSCLPEGWLQ